MRGKMDRSGDDQDLQLNLQDPWVMNRFNFHLLLIKITYWTNSL